MIAPDEISECFRLQREAFDYQAPAAVRLPKLEAVIDMRPRFGLPLEFTAYWVAPGGKSTPVVTRPFEAERERLRAQIKLDELVGDRGGHDKADR